MPSHEMPSFAGRIWHPSSDGPGSFRYILVHEYAVLDYGLVVDTLDNLEPVEAFLSAVPVRLEK